MSIMIPVPLVMSIMIAVPLVMSIMIAVPLVMSIMIAVPLVMSIMIAVPVAAVSPETVNNLTGHATSVVVADLCCNRIAQHISNRQCRDAGDKTRSEDSKR